MATNFPTGLDDLTNPTSGNLLSNSTPKHSEQHANLNDAVEAIEAKVGIDGSADPDSLDARVAALEAGSSHTHVSGEIPTGTVNGINAAFTLVSAPSPAASLMLFLNGLLQRAGGADFTLSSATITFIDPPDTGAVLIAHYIT